MQRINKLLAKLTAFSGIDELKAAMAGGYTPTIMGRTKQHGELVRGLRAIGINVRV